MTYFLGDIKYFLGDMKYFLGNVSQFLSNTTIIVVLAPLKIWLHELQKSILFKASKGLISKVLYTDRHISINLCKLAVV